MLAGLFETIEAEIVPRLLLSHRTTPQLPRIPAVNAQILQSDDVAELGRLLLTDRFDAAFSFIGKMQGRGASIETLYLDLLAPTARHLGDLWTQDLCHFADVTMGLCRLQQVLHEFSPAFLHEVPVLEGGRRALLVSVPGEQHSFGVTMVAEFFRRAGWDAWTGAPASCDALVRMVRTQRFAVVGFSISCDRQLDALASSIRMVRRSSRNRSIGVLVGGRVFVEHPEMVALVGADATAADGRQAPVQAENLLALIPRQR